MWKEYNLIIFLLWFNIFGFVSKLPTFLVSHCLLTFIILFHDNTANICFHFLFCQLLHFISFPDVDKDGREIVAMSRLTLPLLISRTLRTVGYIVPTVTWVLESLIFFTEYLHFSLVWNCRYMDPPGYWISFPDDSYNSSGLVFSCQEKSTSKVSDAFDCCGRLIFWNISFAIFSFHPILHTGNFSFPYFMDLFFWVESKSYLMIITLVLNKKH